MERTPGSSENWDTWEKELATSVTQIKNAVVGDSTLHDGVKTLAWVIISNATKLAGDMALQKHHDLIKQTKLISGAVEKALEILTTDRPLTEEELQIMGVNRAKYDEITKDFLHKNRVINPGSVPMILEELETIKKMGA